jgi:MFS family permease
MRTLSSYFKFLIGLSFTLFGLPMLLFNLIGGSVVDRTRSRRKRVILIGTLVNLVQIFLYAMVHSIVLAIVISVTEAMAMSVTGPSIQTAVMEISPAESRGTIQGWLQAAGR